MTSQLESEPGSGSAELLQWSVTRSDAEVEVFLAGEVDISTVDRLGDVLAAVLADRPPVVAVDVADVSFLDSSGIKCLLAAVTSATEAGECRVVVRRPTSAIERVLSICGVAELLLDGSGGEAASDR